MLRGSLFAAFLLHLVCAGHVEGQKPPREYAKFKCEKRVKNDALLQKCKECVENFSLPQSPSRSDVRNLVKECVPRKDPKQWVKGKCEDNTEKQGDIEACYTCVDNFVLPENATRDDVYAMRRACLPKPGLKFRAKRKCAKKLKTKAEIESCQTCVQSYSLTDNPSCEEVNEMKRKCITERLGRDLWSEPILQDDDDEESS